MTLVEKMEMGRRQEEATKDQVKRVLIIHTVSFGFYSFQKTAYRPVVINASCRLDKIQELSMPEGIILITFIDAGIYYSLKEGATIL